MRRRSEKMANLDISNEKVIESAKIIGKYCKKLFCSNCELVCIFGEHFDLKSWCPMRDFVHYPKDLLRLVNMMERRWSFGCIRNADVVEAAKVLGSYCEQHMSPTCGKTCILSKNVKLSTNMDCPWEDYINYPKDLLGLVKERKVKLRNDE